MKIRNQLIAAFVLLAVLPLTSSVVFSYVATKKAFERAEKAESEKLAGRMQDRMSGIKRDLRRRVEMVGRLPMGGMMSPASDSPEASAAAQRLARSLVGVVGEAAPLVRRFIYMPRSAPDPPHPPAAPVAPASVEAPAPPVLTGPDGSRLDTIEPRKAPMVIDMPQFVEGFEIEAARGDSASGDATSEVGDEALEPFARLGLELAASGLELAVEALRDEGSMDDMAKEIEREILAAQAEARRRRLENRRASHALERQDLAALEERERWMERILGDDFEVEMREQGELVGAMRAEINLKELLLRVLGSTPRDEGEIPFAMDVDGELYTLDDGDREKLNALGLERAPEGGGVQSVAASDDWVISSVQDPDSTFVFGVARPVGEALADMRRTSLRNLLVGLGLVGLSILAILPLSGRISRGVEVVTAGARRIARGDLTARVPVVGQGEIAELARTFNHMAEDLSIHQERLLAEESRRRKQELERHLLEAEYGRKSQELEEARQFQISLLPRSVPEHPSCEIAVDMHTAAEVGGDYYDFFVDDNRVDDSRVDGVRSPAPLTIAVGDATGHGARAGTMVTVIKSLFSASAGELSPGELLARATRTVRRMELGRMAMAFVLARLDGDVLTVASAAMPPILIHRAATGEVEEVVLSGMPLGGLDVSYEERRLRVAPGDVVLLSSDGLPELVDEDGEPFGYVRMREAFATAVAEAPDPAGLIAALVQGAREWTAGGPPQDDMTFVAFKVKAQDDADDAASPPSS